MLRETDKELQDKIDNIYEKLDKLTQKNRKESCRPLTFHEAEAWFGKMDNHFLSGYVEVAFADFDSLKENWDKDLVVDVRKRFENASLHFEDGDFYDGTPVICYDGKRYAYPKPDFVNETLWFHFYVADYQEEIEEIHNFLISN